MMMPEQENTDEWADTNIDRQTNKYTDCWKAMTEYVCVWACVSMSVCVCVFVRVCACDHAPVCVSFQSVHASVPLIILIWLCLLLACLEGDKAEGLSLSHSALYYQAGWAAQDPDVTSMFTRNQLTGWKEGNKKLWGG